MRKAAKEYARRRMWAGLFGAVPFTVHASIAIWYHELISKSGAHKVPAVTGVVFGSIEMAFVLYLLVVYAWGGYRDLKAEGKEKSATRTTVR